MHGEVDAGSDVSLGAVVSDSAIFVSLLRLLRGMSLVELISAMISCVDSANVTKSGMYLVFMKGPCFV